MKACELKKDSVKEGWWYEITPLTFHRFRIILTDGYSVDDGW